MADNIYLSIASNLSVNQDRLGAYTIDMYPSDRECCPLQSEDGAYDNVRRCSGVFASREEAARAVLRYIPQARAVIERLDWVSGATSVELVTELRGEYPHDSERQGATFHILAESGAVTRQLVANNPIADLLGLPLGRYRAFTVDGRAFEIYPARAAARTCETLYRLAAGPGVSNPGFRLVLTAATHHKMALGQYLAGRRGVKRAEAEALVDAVRQTHAEQCG